MSESVFVDIVAGSVEVGCAECQQVIAQGNFFFCVIEKQRHYLIGGYSPKICCGKEKKIPYIFSSKEEAETAMEKLSAEISKYGDLSHLELYLLARIVSPTLQ